MMSAGSSFVSFMVRILLADLEMCEIIKFGKALHLLVSNQWCFISKCIVSTFYFKTTFYQSNPVNCIVDINKPFYEIKQVLCLCGSKKYKSPM